MSIKTNFSFLNDKYIIKSGVIILQTVRNNSKYTDKQKRFHHNLTKFYLAFTFRLFSAIALRFIAHKIIPMAVEFRIIYVKNIFFIGLMTLYFIRFVLQ
jgi:hypothetical protein